MDRRNAADDNGEQLFKYALSRKDNVKKYFTVSEDSKDYSRLAGKYKNVLPSQGAVQEYNDSQYQWGLKPYVYYSCRYVKGSEEVIVIYLKIK